MKKFALVLAVLTALCAVAGLAGAEGERTLREGKYIIGEDIAPGTYTLTCIETAGGELNDAYGALGDAMNALDGSQDYGSMFGALGGMLETYVDMTVEVVGDYGDILKSCDMKVGDSIRIELKEKTALQITDGSCTIAAEE